MKHTAPPPSLLVLAAIVSVQFGAALAATLLERVGVLGSVTLRLVISGVIMVVVARPRLRGHRRADWVAVTVFGMLLAMMNTLFYSALHRLPIGVAVTVEFIGPLVLAASTSRRARDVVAVLAAAVGVVLISGLRPSGLTGADPLGLLFALGAGAAWAGYVIASARVGARFPRLDGLSLAMIVAAAAVAPAGIVTAGSTLLRPDVLAAGVGIAVLSSALPYSLELLALRRMPARTFGVLLSLEPAVAALAGFLLLDQVLGTAQLLGMGAVVAASATVTANEPSDPVAESRQ